MASVKSFVGNKVVVLHHDATVHQAARAMCDHQIGCVVVANHDGKMVGMVTDRDLVCGFLAESSGLVVELADVMTPGLYSVSDEADLNEVVSLMETHGVRRVPIIRKHEDGREYCVGLISFDDLIMAQSVDPGHLATIVRSQLSDMLRKPEQEGFVRELRVHARSLARTEQTLHRFIHRICERTRLDPEMADRFLRTAMQLVVERMQFRSAGRFIAQLPQQLHDELLDLPAGPNRRISRQTFFDRCATEFKWDGPKTAQMLHGLWFALADHVGATSAEHARLQLPDDVRSLFPGPEELRSEESRHSETPKAA